MIEMETNLIQIMSALLIIVSSSIPLHFALKIKSCKQRVLSSLLLVALLAYAGHSLLESLGLFTYQIFAKICLIVSAFGLMAAYSFYQVKTNHAMIGGIFGVAMIAAFGSWMTGEVAEAVIITNEESTEMLDSISSIIMAGFGAFLIARFFWLKSVIPIEPKYMRS